MPWKSKKMDSSSVFKEFIGSSAYWGVSLLVEKSIKDIEVGTIILKSGQPWSRGANKNDLLGLSTMPLAAGESGNLVVAVRGVVVNKQLIEWPLDTPDELKTQVIADLGDKGIVFIDGDRGLPRYPHKWGIEETESTDKQNRQKKEKVNEPIA